MNKHMILFIYFYFHYFLVAEVSVVRILLIDIYGTGFGLVTKIHLKKAKKKEQIDVCIFRFQADVL